MERTGDEDENEKGEAGGGGGGNQGTWDSWAAGPRRREPQAAKPAVPRVYVWKRQGPRPHRRDLLTRAPEGVGGDSSRLLGALAHASMPVSQGAYEAPDHT